MERDILHLSIPAFPIAVARVADPALCGRPVAIAPGNSDRALVQCLSAEALEEGLHEGIPVYRARRYCPSLVLLPPDERLAGRAMQALLKVSSRYSPVWETVTAGRLFLDLTGGRRLFGAGRDVAARLEKEVARGLRLGGTVGVAGNKLISRIASNYLQKPGVCDVLRGSEKAFIGPLPVSSLPGVGRARQQQLLQELNLRRVEEVAALSVPQLRLAFGPFAPLLQQRASGIDPSPVQPPRRSAEVAEEGFLCREENDDAVLLAELCRLVEGCGLRLRTLGKQAMKLTLTVRYGDGVTEQRTTTLPSPASHDLVLYDAAERLFHRACQRRSRVKGLRLQCSALAAEAQQMDLFTTPEALPPRQLALQSALDQLRNKYGMSAVARGRSLYSA